MLKVSGDYSNRKFAKSSSGEKPESVLTPSGLSLTDSMNAPQI
jgi:hypothetical protein